MDRSPGWRVTPARFGDGRAQPLLPHGQLDVRQALKVQAGLAELVLAKLGQQRLRAVEAAGLGSRLRPDRRRR